MARPFLTEIPTQDAWVVIKDLMDLKVDDWDLALRTINDCMSYASWAALNVAFQGVGENADGRVCIRSLANGGARAPATFNWKAILAVLLDLLKQFLDR